MIAVKFPHLAPVGTSICGPDDSGYSRDDNVLRVPRIRIEGQVIVNTLKVTTCGGCGYSLPRWDHTVDRDYGAEHRQRRGRSGGNRNERINRRRSGCQPASLYATLTLHVQYVQCRVGLVVARLQSTEAA